MEVSESSTPLFYRHLVKFTFFYFIFYFFSFQINYKTLHKMKKHIYRMLERICHLHLCGGLLLQHKFFLLDKNCNLVPCSEQGQGKSQTTATLMPYTILKIPFKSQAYLWILSERTNITPLIQRSKKRHTKMTNKAVLFGVVCFFFFGGGGVCIHF